MQIRISKESNVPIQEQIREQIIFLIATEELKPGQILPSVRELARRLKIHHNTVSHVYTDLVGRSWLERKKGSRLSVRSQDQFTNVTRSQDLDSMINAVIRVARAGGHSLQELRDRVQRRLIAHAPDHLLVIDDDPGLRQLLQQEIREVVRWPSRGCSREELRLNSGLAVGALPVVAQHYLPDVVSLLPKNRPAISLTYCQADEHLHMIRNLEQPSVIALVSVSKVFLQTARGVLAPSLEDRHTLSEFVWPMKKGSDIRAADLVFCDSIAFEQVKHPKRVLYRLIVPSSLQYVAAAMKSYYQQ
jgi:DNA-binding transcriptional regulator YhcF (GntR family)